MTDKAAAGTVARGLLAEIVGFESHLDFAELGTAYSDTEPHHMAVHFEREVE